MAYKFQKGNHLPSGSIIQASGTFDINSVDVNTGGISEAGAISGATSIDGSGDLTMGTITMTGFSVDADGDTALKSLAIDDGSTIGPDSVTDLITMTSDGDITIKNGTYDFDIASQDGTNGLKLAGVLVGASAAEINVLDGVTAGTAAASKAVVLDGSKDVTGINNLTIAGNLTVNGTTTTVDTTNLLVKDKLITINNGGAATSADGAGIEFEEDGSPTGFIKVSGSRAEIHMQAPANSNTLTIDMDASGEIEFGAAKKLTVAGNFNIDADISAEAAEINLLDDITRGSIIYGNASGASARLAKGAANTVLTSDGTDISYGNVTNAMLAGSIADSKLSTISTAGKVDIGALEIDGASEMGAGLADADLFIVDDGGNGTEKSALASRIPTYVFSKMSVDVTVASNGVASLTADALTGKTALTSGLAGGDQLFVHDATDGAALKRMTVNVLSSFVGNNSSETHQTLLSSLSQDYTLDPSDGRIVFLNVQANSMNVNLPNASDFDGQILKFKKSAHASNFALLTPSGSQEVDGDNNGISLSSPFAAVMLVASGSAWFVL